MTTSVRAGSYRYLLTFQIQVEQGRDTAGGLIYEWEDDFTVRGSYEPMNSDLLKTDVGDKRFAEIHAMFKIRYDPTPGRIPDATRHRLVFQTDPVASPAGQSIWDIYPPLQVDGKYREWHIKARQYR